MAELYLGRSSWNEEKVGRIDSNGDVYAGRNSWNEEKVGRIEGAPRRSGAAAILLLLR